MRVVGSLTKLVTGMSRLGEHLLKQKVRGVIVAALAFACGSGLVYSLKHEAQLRQVAPPAAPANCPPPGTYSAPSPVAGYVPADDEEEEYGTQALQEWKNRHNGVTLPLDYDTVPSRLKPSESKVVLLPSGRILVTAGDGLYMLGADRRVVWKHTVSQWVYDFEYIRATGLIYGTAGDNNMFILDASTGKELFGDARSGRAWYGDVLPYGEDACLIVDMLGGYRADYAGGPEPMQDGVTAWRGTRMLWHMDVPPDAELQVVGSKIYAVTKTKDRILLKELRVPRGGR